VVFEDAIAYQSDDVRLSAKTVGGVEDDESNIPLFTDTDGPPIQISTDPLG